MNRQSIPSRSRRPLTAPPLEQPPVRPGAVPCAASEAPCRCKDPTPHDSARVGATGDPEHMTRRSPDDAFLDVVPRAAHARDDDLCRRLRAGRRPLARTPGPTIAADLVHEVEALYRLVEDLVVFGRATSPDTVEHEPVLVSRVVLEVIEQERVLVSDHRIAFSGPRDAVAGAADPTMVRHVVRNLLDNAIRYAPSGGTVEVVVHQTADEVVVRVLDGSRHEGTADDDERWPSTHGTGRARPRSAPARVSACMSPAASRRRWGAGRGPDRGTVPARSSGSPYRDPRDRARRAASPARPAARRRPAAV